VAGLVALAAAVEEGDGTTVVEPDGTDTDTGTGTEADG
jgi:hypothetical protein